VTPEAQQVPLRYPDGKARTLADFVAACPPGAVVELAPGRYPGPLILDKPVLIRGAGDLTRIFGRGSGRLLEVRIRDGGQASLESVLLDGGDPPSGAGIHLESGRLRLFNVHIQRCVATGGGGGGAIHVTGGELDASVLRVNDVSGDRGGAIWVEGSATVRVRDSQFTRAQARQGGALAVQGTARVSLEAVTVGKARATTPSGGQAVYISGAPGVRPTVFFRRVRLEDVPLGLPLVVDPKFPGDVSLTGCDMPRVVQGVVGVVDGGENHWR
jgi:hypothetical protein